MIIVLREMSFLAASAGRIADLRISSCMTLIVISGFFVRTAVCGKSFFLIETVLLTETNIFHFCLMEMNHKQLSIIFSRLKSYLEHRQSALLTVKTESSALLCSNFLNNSSCRATVFLLLCSTT